MPAGKKSTTVLSLLLLLLLWIFPAQAQDISDKLDATFTTADGSTSFRYIGDWHTRSTGSLPWLAFSGDMASDESVFSSNQPISGEIRVSIRAGYEWHANSLSQTDGTSKFTSAMDVMNYTHNELEEWIPQSGVPVTDIQLSDVVETTLAGETAAYLTLLTPTFEQIYLLVWYSDGFSNYFTLTAAPGELGKWQPIALAMADSFSFDFDTILSPEEWQASPPVANSTIAYTTDNLPELTNTYTSTNDNFTFDYPKGWLFARENQYRGNDVVSLSTDPLLLDDITPIPETGQVAVVVMLFDISKNGLDIEFDASAVEALQAYFGVSPIGFITYYGYSMIQPITINDHPTALAASDLRFGYGRYGDGMVVLRNFENGFWGVVIVMAPYNELNLWQDTALAIAASMQYRPD